MEKKDKQIRELQAQLKQLPEGREEPEMSTRVREVSGGLSKSVRHEVDDELKKLKTLKGQVDGLQREKDFLEQQLRTYGQLQTSPGPRAP